MKLKLTIGYNFFLIDMPKEDTGILFNALKDAKQLDYDNAVLKNDEVLDISISVYKPPKEEVQS